VIGNDSIGEKSDERHPAAVVTSWNQHPSALKRLLAVAKELGIAYAGKVSRGMPKSAKIMNGRQIPSAAPTTAAQKETGSLEVTLFDVRLSPRTISPSMGCPALLCRCWCTEGTGSSPWCPGPCRLGKPILPTAMRQAPVPGPLTLRQSGRLNSWLTSAPSHHDHHPRTLSLRTEKGRRPQRALWNFLKAWKGTAEQWQSLNGVHTFGFRSFRLGDVSASGSVPTAARIPRKENRMDPGVTLHPPRGPVHHPFRPVDASQSRKPTRPDD